MAAKSRKFRLTDRQAKFMGVLIEDGALCADVYDARVWRGLMVRGLVEWKTVAYPNSHLVPTADGRVVYEVLCTSALAELLP